MNKELLQLTARVKGLHSNAIDVIDRLSDHIPAGTKDILSKQQGNCGTALSALEDALDAEIQNDTSVEEELPDRAVTEINRLISNLLNAYKEGSSQVKLDAEFHIMNEHLNNLNAHARTVH